MESDSATAQEAKAVGWKLSSGADPASVAVQHYSGSWRLLDDKFSFEDVTGMG